MPTQPERYIQCQRDGYISVRTFDGKFLGCIPGYPPQEDFLQTQLALGDYSFSALPCEALSHGIGIE
jgi:hypothetical protein